MSRYVLLPTALDDLDQIWEFIATDSLDAADKVIEEIYAHIDLLAKNPGSVTSVRILLGVLYVFGESIAI